MKDSVSVFFSVGQPFQSFEKSIAPTRLLILSFFRSQLDSNVASPSVLNEFQLWEQEWVWSCRQLNEWEVLGEVCRSEDHPNPHLILDCAWRNQDWNKVEDNLNIVSTFVHCSFSWDLKLIYIF